ncbi:MAG: hypothetical protein F6K40_09010 [Okeania sp. SIO3I5]|uniref:hypothetical protein n=1 Tax=Okeania sp. SIO3I5 TaxID=2607805 RepID=UPI0013BC1262|nr:hypothetical protein [Okeania sp. SIO3I5]NEQ36403.1 hypothetical protein [Okeania sp. SIO3I5]
MIQVLQKRRKVSRLYPRKIKSANFTSNFIETFDVALWPYPGGYGDLWHRLLLTDWGTKFFIQPSINRFLAWCPAADIFYEAIE